MKKRGQFYLITALIVIGIILGLTAVYNAVKIAEEDMTLYDLSSEINYEAGRVIDYGVFNALTDGQIAQNLEYLLSFYAEENPGKDLVVIYGNETDIFIIFYNNTMTGSVSISLGVEIEFNIEGIVVRSEAISRTDAEQIEIILGEGVTYTFTLRPGQVFFLVLTQESETERIVSLPESEENLCVPDEEGEITICHHNQDSQEFKTIKIDEEDLREHIGESAHGQEDYCGPCV